MCKCEREIVLDDNGDWDVRKNSETLTGTDLIKLYAGVDESGFYLEAGSFEADAFIDFRPKFCPFCGRKLRNDMIIEYVEVK